MGVSCYGKNPKFLMPSQVNALLERIGYSNYRFEYSSNSTELLNFIDSSLSSNFCRKVTFQYANDFVSRLLGQEIEFIKL